MAKKRAKKPLEKFLPESVQATGAAADESGSALGTDSYSGSRRIRDCGQARELFVRLYLENQLRAQSFAQVRNQIEGGRPFDPQSLVRNGEGWRTNVNFRDAESMFLRSYLPFWKMVHEVPRKIAVTIHSTSNEADKWGIAMAEAFDRFLDDWGPDYFMQFMGFSRDFVKYGPGFVMWEDSRTPRYKWAQTVQLLFPKRTKSNPDQWELVALRREMTADQLIEKIRNKQESDRSRTVGWNPAAINNAIKTAAPAPYANRYFDPNVWQDMIVSNDLVIGGVWPPIAVVDIWAKERDGRIRHYIFTENSAVNDYLFEGYEEAKTFREIFGPVFYDVGENGLLHSVKGFGVKNYYYATSINRTKCRLLDSATFAMGMNFVKDDNTPEEAPPVESYSMVNLFPKGLNQLQYYPQLQAAEGILQMLTQAQSENNYSYTDPQRQIAETDTATQGKLLAALSAEMESATSATYLSQIGTNLFSEMVRRLCAESDDPDAKKFKKRCLELGVPSEALKMERTVKTGASPTMASAGVRAEIAQQLMTVIYPLPGANRRGIEEFYTANLTGSQGPKNFLLPIGTESDPRARREAMMENVDLAQGIPLPVDPSDAHAEHVDEHLKPLEAIVKAAQEGQQISGDHLAALQFGLVHTNGHMEFLASDDSKKGLYQELKARFTNVANITRGLMARLSKAQDQGGDPNAVAAATGRPQQ